MPAVGNRGNAVQILLKFVVRIDEYRWASFLSYCGNLEAWNGEDFPNKNFCFVRLHLYFHHTGLSFHCLIMTCHQPPTVNGPPL